MHDKAQPEMYLLPRPASRGRLRSYNQFPLFYDNIRAMEDDLPRIAAMGFTSVWVNPMFETCKNPSWVFDEITRVLGPTKKSEMYALPGCPYSPRSLNINKKISAHANEGLTEDQRREKDYDDISHYTEKALSLGLTPLFDIVMRHIAVDHPLVQEKPHWIKRHPNGNYCFFNRDENYKPSGKTWDDVLEFNFDDDKARQEILDEYIKPMLSLAIDRLGFQGLRIDAAGKIPIPIYKDIVPYVDNLCLKRHGKPALIISETLGEKIDEFFKVGGYTDYACNSLYFYPFDQSHWMSDGTSFSHAKGLLQGKVAPTIGFPGSHDVQRLSDYYVNYHHVRDDALRQAFAEECIKGNIKPGAVEQIFMKLNSKNGFRIEQLIRFINVAEQQGILTSDDANASRHEVHKNGRLTSHKILRNMFPPSPQKGSPPSAMSEKQQVVLQALVHEFFEVVKREKQIARDEFYSGEKTKKLITEKTFVNLMSHSLDKASLSRLVKEGFCFTAFASDGGYFFFMGDEWGVTKKVQLFERESCADPLQQQSSPNDLKLRAYDGLDFSGMIRSINAVVEQLPPPANPEWVQRCYLKDPIMNKNVVSFLIHQGEGFSNPPHLVIANVSEEAQTIDGNTFMELLSANGRNDSREKRRYPYKIYICGNVQLTPELQNSLKEMQLAVFHSEEASAPNDLNKTPSPHKTIAHSPRL